MRFRKKPVEVEATQYRPWDPSLPEGVCLCHHQQHRLAHVHTLGGLMLVSAEDWIIKGVKGEFYPCKSDIFEATYEEFGTGEKDDGSLYAHARFPQACDLGGGETWGKYEMPENRRRRA